MTETQLDSDLIERNEVHKMGEIWAVTLNDMYWNLVDDFGFSEDIFDSSQSQGNIVALQLMVGGMMVQPCNPTYLDARDAIFQTDINYYNGRHQCQIWKAFAKRGMGVNATSNFQDNHEIPKECGSSDPSGELIDINFKSDYNHEVSKALHVGSFVRVSYDLIRIGSPCDITEICTFMNKDAPMCRRIAHESEVIQSRFLLKKPGKLNIYFHVSIGDRELKTR